MSEFGEENWVLELLPVWIGEHSEECSTIYHPEGVGALQISAYTKDGIVTETDLKSFAREHVESGATLSASDSGDFKGFTVALGLNSEYWQYWYVARGSIALLLTYNCEIDDREKEIADVKAMVASLSAT